MVRRLFVEKKSGFDVEAQGLFEDIRTNLHVKNVKAVRILNRYDIDGISDEVFNQTEYAVFAEPPIDNTFLEELPEDVVSAIFFAVELLPGQFDQRADSAETCIKLIMPHANPVVKFAKVIAIYGDISAEDLKKIKAYCINPVDSREASLEKLDDLEEVSPEPEDVEIIDGFVDMTESQLDEFRDDRELAMTREDLYAVCEYFKEVEGRNPSITELKVIDTYWSDHCRHTTFNTKIEGITFQDSPYGKVVKEAYDEYKAMRDFVYEGREKDESLMDIACIGAKYLKKMGKLDDLDESDEINACSIKVKAVVNGSEEDWLVMFKNETHNHPTEIEPFGGAATCLGGAIRDPLSGRAYVYQAMRVTGAGDPRTPVEETLEGKLPQIKITREAAAGYSSYGNQIGLATGLVDEIYDKNYVAKRMEVGAVIGATPASHVIREKPVAGDIVILLGGKTGRDGCGGATGSSKEHTKDSMDRCGAEVQKGNPLVERNIQRLFRRREVATLIKKCNDFGAGGVSVAIGELSDGLDINLDLVQKKYNGLDGTELAISESQERMAVVVAHENVEKFRAFAREENLEATAVAKVTDDNRVKMRWRGKTILDISRGFLDTNGAKQQVKLRVTDENLEKAVFRLEDYFQALENLNCCSKKGLIERFDSTIGGNTVIMPLGGKYQLSPAIGMAAKLPVVEGETDTATVMTYGYDPDIAKYSPFHGAMYAVIDSVTKVVAMGGRLEKIRLSFQEYFEKLTDESSWGKPFAALLGALKVQRELEIPAIGGKDSMSGTFMDINVPPALISFAVEAMDAGNVISTEFKRANSKIIILPARYNENGIIDFDAYKKNMDTVSKLTEEKMILSANIIGKGGIFVSLVKMAVGNKIGADVKNLPKDMLFSANYGGVILEVADDKSVDMLKKIDGIEVGNTIEEEKIYISDLNKTDEFDIDELIDVWMKPLEDVFPTETVDEKNMKDNAKKVATYEKCNDIPTLSYEKRYDIEPKEKVDVPKVVIPLFPGTNCEVDSARAFRRAGADVHIHLIRNVDSDALEESIRGLAQKIRESNIIMIPGGFSGGDEPDGSAKFITAVFRNPVVRGAVTDLIENRDGLIIGICNGFQALIKLGLVPFGKIMDADENSPTLSYNKIGRHMSGLVKTRVASVKSPWMANADVGDVLEVPVSHGEGRFICNRELLRELAEDGQILTQYVDFNGKASMDTEHNPNFSIWAVEGITSKDGRILGKMGHSERIGKNVYKNVSGEKNLKLFESAVEYFRKK